MGTLGHRVPHRKLGRRSIAFRHRRLGGGAAYSGQVDQFRRVGVSSGILRQRLVHCPAREADRRTQTISISGAPAETNDMRRPSRAAAPTEVGTIISLDIALLVQQWRTLPAMSFGIALRSQSLMLCSKLVKQVIPQRSRFSSNSVMARLGQGARPAIAQCSRRLANSKVDRRKHPATGIDETTDHQCVPVRYHS
jgi:hypothetical protein